MTVSPIPEGAHTVTPHLVIRNAAKAIEFYKAAFGAEEVFRSDGPNGGQVMHAEIRIGDSPVYIADEIRGMGIKSPESLKGTAVTIHLYVEDADSVFRSAVDAGATVAMEIQDAFWGDRYGQVTDPFGHHWAIATHKEDLSAEEMMERAKTAFGG